MLLLRWRTWTLLAGLLLPMTAALACGPYRVGVKLYPQVYEKVPGRPGEYRGLDKDFFEQLGQRSGCRFELVLESQPRIWARLRGGSLDITNWALPTPERRTWAQFMPLASGNPVVLSWRNRTVTDAADLLARRELRVVVVRDASYGSGLDTLLATLRQQGRVSEVGDIDAAVRVFFARRVDLLISYPWLVAGALRGREDEVELADWFPDQPGALSSLALSRRQVSAVDAQRLLAAVQAMQRDGSLERLLRQHLPREGITPLSRIELMP